MSDTCILIRGRAYQRNIHCYLLKFIIWTNKQNKIYLRISLAKVKKQRIFIDSMNLMFVYKNMCFSSTFKIFMLEFNIGLQYVEYVGI